MANIDPRVDSYIAKSADFAKPILTHIRELVHEACPAVTETIKWSMPAFECKGLLCTMGAFREHVALAFWAHKLVVGSAAKPGAMGQFGRIQSLRDLPPKKVLLGYVSKPALLRQSGRKSTATRRLSQVDVQVPSFLLQALEQNRAARDSFASLPPSHRREYIRYLMEAKRDETRQRRLNSVLASLSKRASATQGNATKLS